MSKLKKNVLYNGVLTGSNLILPFIIFPYITRVLEPEGIGQINFANSFIQYFVIISSLGIPFYGIREIAKVRDNTAQRTTILFELFSIKFICSLIAIVIYLFLIFSVDKFNDYLAYYLLGLGTIVIGIFDLNYFFSALEDFKYITLRSVFFQIVSIIATFVLIKTKDDSLIYFCIPIIISLLNTLVNTKYIFKFIDFSVIKSKLQLRSHIKPLFLLFSVMVFTSVYNLLDVTLLGFLSGNSSVGYYSVASKINKIPLSLIMVLVPVMLPRIAMEFKKENYIEINRLISKTIQFVILLGVPIMVGLFVTAPEIISLFSGAEFAPSVDTIRIMSPIVLIIGITTNFSTQFLVPLGKDRQLLYAVIYGTVTSVVLNFILIPLFQHNGAAFSNLFAELVVLFACYYYVKKYMQISIPFKQIIINTILCLPFLGFVLISRQLLSSAFLVLFFSVTISIVYYLTIQILILKNSIMVELKNTTQNKLQSIFKF
ncbi:flippase [Flavobacterium sp. ZS1P70]|jgi:O-antigen/teichoic acid export membrane protein|uniref:Flippase n=1 Tax=Flavobacterium zhoui TaxID=3230414 RepID=A0ABW6I7S2_9FLAO